ncbi:MAG: sensor histidine kinase [Victivallales bacterium]
MGTLSFEKIRISLMAVFFIVAIIPLALLSRRIILQGEKLIKDKAALHLIDLADGNINSLDRFMQERISDMQVMSNIVAESKKNEDFIRFQIENFKKQYRMYIGIALTDDSGRPLITSHGLSKESIDDIRKYVSEKNDLATETSDVFLTKISKRDVPVFVICSDIEVIEGGLKHLCSIVDFRYVSAILKESEIEGTGEVYIVNKNGYFLSESRFGAKTLKDRTLVVKKDKQSSSAIVIKDYRGHDVFHVQREYGAHSWYIIAEQDTKETLSQIEKLKKETLIYVLLVTVGVLVMSFIVSTLIVNILKSKYEYEKELEFEVVQKDKLAALGLLTAGLAHELNTPLANALLYAQIARSELNGNDLSLLDERLSTIEDEVKHGGQIVKNLLSFSHHTIDDTKSTNVNDVIIRLLTIAGPHGKSRGISLLVDYEKDIPSVKADMSIVQEIITNIVANAIDTTPDGGEIKITTKYIPVIEKIRVDVSDSGPGIPKDIIGKIFDPFFTTKKPGKGTGLGLFICYQMIRRLGGDIKAISICEGTTKTGTTFTIELPVDK